ncbi:MAG: antibiotic biosynthesis monooxygenase [Saprospiraceae bacterium]|nr:antibiotic biosynthesis monooxygenase [Saprospiraceae bacterium]MCF8252509.1 antibiotic biosynthesis monooxygenase [Saprospiraceae bacterium]MCF8282533.1 antibiotic biosynthesis monooxygenase [Bacteroidales bacterium]MCF8314102.1 antibiotic biosynthesis monooxygenase [Saprospiraceae bacterium]MCF8442863.1 antibiotic biosynthesis monooxygenase [Saprospiraceae bacterium]
MIKRIVKLTFKEEFLPDFMAIFEESKARIRAFDGNLHLELLQDAAQPNVLFTLSFWENEAALERYRQSGLFRATWAKTKVLFADKPAAWTTVVIGD